MSVTGPRPALFVERDREVTHVIRRLKHHCTVEAWNNPLQRAAAIAECWRLSSSIRSEGQTLVSPLPVTLYADPVSGDVLYAYVHTSEASGKWIDPKTGATLLCVSTVGLVKQATSYATWAEGPLPYTGELDGQAPPDPFADRDLQAARHKNRWLRAAIDEAAAPALDAIPHDLWAGSAATGFVDFRVRGLFSQPQVRVLESKQADGDAKLVLDGQAFSVTELVQE